MPERRSGNHITADRSLTRRVLPRLWQQSKTWPLWGHAIAVAVSFAAIIGVIQLVEHSAAQSPGPPGAVPAADSNAVTTTVTTTMTTTTTTTTTTTRTEGTTVASGQSNPPTGSQTSTTATPEGRTTPQRPAVQGDTRRILEVAPLPTQCAFNHAANGQLLPDRACTPGVTATRVNQANIKTTICVPGYTDTVRAPAATTVRLKIAAERAYGLTTDPTIEYDHLIPLELGGANDTRNLWPEPATSPSQTTSANAKDRVETKLHDLVCADRMRLADAQQRIATDWTTAIP